MTKSSLEEKYLETLGKAEQAGIAKMLRHFIVENVLTF
jgi:hypothetical protein